MCLVLNKNKNKVNGIPTTSLESIDMLPGTPESGAPQDGGNLFYIKKDLYLTYIYEIINKFI